MANLIQNWLLDPVALIFFTSLVTIVILYTRRGSSRRGWKMLLVAVWLAVFLVSSAPTIVNPILTTLEDQYPSSTSCESGSHLVMLGGGVDSRVLSAMEFERMSDSTMARASAAARIAAAEPQLTIIAAGGALKEVTEADVIANYWIALGIDDSRIKREGTSSNTRENAVNVASLLKAESIEGPVRLVTSALHMPRALLTFRAVLNEQGIVVCPVSVDRESLIPMPRMAWVPQTTALVKFDKWLHEIVALAIYRLRGWL